MEPRDNGRKPLLTMQYRRAKKEIVKATKHDLTHPKLLTDKLSLLEHQDKNSETEKKLTPDRSQKLTPTSSYEPKSARKMLG